MKNTLLEKHITIDTKSLKEIFKDFKINDLISNN
jgi:hypothetical protein